MATHTLSHRILAAALIAVGLGGCATPAPQPSLHQQLAERLRQDPNAKPEDLEENYSPADRAECRAQGNAAFGGWVTKSTVYYDCLHAKWYRAQEKQACYAKKN
jgi:hypothetical protein